MGSEKSGYGPGPTAVDSDISAEELNEAFMLGDAERASPGRLGRILNGMVERGEDLTWQDVVSAMQDGQQ